MTASESPLLAAARAQDAAGRHGEAIDTLARATRGGDRQAMTELGHRLLTGDRAPLLPIEGLKMIADAAARGDARALARMAALTAGGAYLRQDWPAALQLLGEAAAAGDDAARGQRACLQGLDLSAWLQPAVRTALHDKVQRAPGMIPAAVCSWLVGRAAGRLERARVYDSVGQREIVNQMRSNTAAGFTLATIDVVQFLVQARMAATCGEPLVKFESPTILHYEVGQQIRPHYDFIDPASPDYERQIREQGQRMITFLLYLNDEYEGGETTFPELGIVNRGARGDGLYFINAHGDGAPDRSMLHTGSPPTAGEKWIVSQFIRNIPLRS